MVRISVLNDTLKVRTWRDDLFRSRVTRGSRVSVILSGKFIFRVWVSRPHAHTHTLAKRLISPLPQKTLFTFSSAGDVQR